MKATSTLTKGIVLLCTFVLSTVYSHSLLAEEDLFAIYCPADVTVDCQTELWDLSGYGNAYYTDYNGSHDAGEPVVNYNLSSCNVGTITRTWTVEDYNWNLHSCSQTITVNATGGFNANNIHWPEPFIELTGCNPAYTPADLPYGFGYPTYDYAECSLIGVSYDDQIFQMTPQCRKVLRTYKVIDWCSYSEGGPYSTGLYTFTQTIKISTAEVPQVDFAEEIIFESFNCENRTIEVPPLYVPPNSCGGDYIITNNSPFADEQGADISGVYPVGTTTVTYTVRYGCFHKVFHTIDIVVIDAKAPTPYCLAEIVTALMPIDDNEDGIADDGMVEIWAKDLNLGSFSSCGHEPLQFSFSEDVDDTFRVFDCSHVGENHLRMYVTDSNGNFNWCEVNIVVQNNAANIQDCDGSAPPTYNVSGMVMMSDAQRVAYANIDLIATEPIVETYVGWDTTEVIVTDSVLNAHGYWEVRRRYELKNVYGTHERILTGEATAITNEDGHFMLDQSVRAGHEYMITAHYDSPTGNINYADVKALLYHLQGIESLNTSEDYLAADINRDHNIDYKDLSILLQYVNGINPTLSDVSWVAVDAHYEVEHPADIISEDCPDAIYVTPSGADLVDKDFIIIELGDITDETLIIAPDVLVGQELQDAIADNLDGEIENITRSLILSEQGVRISPNPFHEHVVIRHTVHQDQDVHIRITDIKGAIVYDQSAISIAGTNEYTIDLSDQISGMYLCTISSEDTRETIKIVKE